MFSSKKNELNDLKRNLLSLMHNDEEVKQAIQLLVSREEKSIIQKDNFDMTNEEHQKEIEKLKLLILELRQENSKLNQSLKQKVTECAEQKVMIKELQKNEQVVIQQMEVYKRKLHSLELEKINIEHSANVYKSNYEKLDSIYSKYLQLGDVIHKQLERVLNPEENAVDSAELFFGFGIQEKNLITLWDIIATNADTYAKLEKIEDLIDIFEYFFECYKKITYKQVEINIPIVGDIYDERFHTRTGNSNATGKITKVILTGFTIGKNISKKALVCVE